MCSGGEEVLLDVGGQDSTEAFEDVGHSDEAREILEGLLVGNLKRQVRLSVLLSTTTPFSCLDCNAATRVLTSYPTILSHQIFGPGNVAGTVPRIFTCPPEAHQNTLLT
jgi:cytochrome b involved in lipid metabolism